MHFIALILYSVFFFWPFWSNPHLNNTSEMATTFYPHWKWMGDKLKKMELPFTDKIYYKFPVGIPFLSTFYPLHLLTSLTGSFRVLQYNILLHYLITSLLSYHLFSQWCSPVVSVFGAITLSYSGYCIKLQQPCIPYTLAWIPGIFLDGWLGVFSMTMALYGGYYPVLIYLMPFILVVHTKTVLLGILFSLPQIIPFLFYFKKSVRWKEGIKSSFGRVPLGKLVELILPLRPHKHTNDVFYMEMAMYMGCAFLFIWFSGSRFWYVLLFGLSVAAGLIRPWQRIPARALYIVTLSISILATDGLSKLGLNNDSLWLIVLLQAVLLLFNRDIYPCFPFTQWWRKDHRLDYTGYLSGVKLNDYRGAFSLK